MCRSARSRIREEGGWRGVVVRLEVPDRRGRDVGVEGGPASGDVLDDGGVGPEVHVDHGRLVDEGEHRVDTAHVDQDRAPQLGEYADVDGPGRSHRTDERRLLALEDRREPGQQTLYGLLKDDVRLVQTALGAGRRVVVHLDGERRTIGHGTGRGGGTGEGTGGARRGARGRGRRPRAGAAGAQHERAHGEGGDPHREASHPGSPLAGADLPDGVGPSDGCPHAALVPCAEPADAEPPW